MSRTGTEGIFIFELRAIPPDEYSSSRGDKLLLARRDRHDAFPRDPCDLFRSTCHDASKDA